MYAVNAISRETCETTCENYASFETYAEARAFADKHEMEARARGWTWVVRQVIEAAEPELYHVDSWVYPDGREIWTVYRSEDDESVADTDSRADAMSLCSMLNAEMARWHAARC